MDHPAAARSTRMPIIDCYSELGPQPYPSNATTVEAFERLMKKFGIDMTFVVSTEALRSSMEEGNAWLYAQINGQHNLRGYCVVNPLMFEASQEQMRQYLVKEQFIGAILHEGYIKRPLNADVMRKLVKALLRYDKPLMLRITDPREINDLHEIAQEFPTQRFIIQHMANQFWPMVVSLVEKSVNILLETGGMVADFDKFAEAVQVVGAHRLLFGTGMPMVNPVYALGMVRDSSISVLEKDRILARNAKKLFVLE